MEQEENNLVDEIREKIIQNINSYEYISGQILSESAIATAMGVSRTPVREALIQLTIMGLLERKNKKVIVKPILSSDITEILQLLEAVELMTVNILFRRGGATKNEINQLEDVLHKLGDTSGSYELKEKFNLDSLFHTTLVSFSENARMIEIFRCAKIQAYRLHWMTVLTPNRFSESLKEYESLIVALKNNDMAKCSDAISEIITNSNLNYQHILSDNKWERMMLEMRTMGKELCM